MVAGRGRIRAPRVRVQIHNAIRTAVFGLVMALAAPPAPSAPVTADGCRQCHAREPHGFEAGHAVACNLCHAGEPAAATPETAHQGLIAFPGNLSNADRTCGTCHAAIRRDVHHSLMNTARGMVSTTRAVFDEPASGTIRSLGKSPADSLLRKLCVGCHLGFDRTERTDDLHRTGGGCLACHLKRDPRRGHPQLTAKVGDERCFGCHSRSARTALNYAGLAELDPELAAKRDPRMIGYLPDGRLVERKPTDVHHRAGMSCIDCHVQEELMGPTGEARHSSDAVRIRCEDCHRRQPGPGKPARDSQDAAGAVTTRDGAAMRNVEARANGLWLRRKVNGGALPIPPYRRASHPLDAEHARLTCAACHSQWAPQCYGCHTSFDPKGKQWDYVDGAVTAGRWNERRWPITSGPPSLGVGADNRIRPFVPGMILTIEHPDWKGPRFKRLFAPTSPHTVGPSRSCASCHCSSTALGLGEGKWITRDGQRIHVPDRKPLADGLPADAWTRPGDPGLARSTHRGARPFNDAEMARILGVGCNPRR